MDLLCRRYKQQNTEKLRSWSGVLVGGWVAEKESTGQEGGTRMRGMLSATCSSCRGWFLLSTASKTNRRVMYQSRCSRKVRGKVGWKFSLTVWSLAHPLRAAQIRKAEAYIYSNTIRIENVSARWHSQRAWEELLRCWIFFIKHEYESPKLVD